MSLYNDLLKLNQLDALLRRNTPGDATYLASRLGVSRRTIFRYFEDLRDWGAEIRYCPSHKGYHYLQQPALPVPDPVLYAPKKLPDKN